MILDVTDETFEAEVIQRSASMPVVVDLWAPWCGPCRTLGPIIEAAVAQANEGHDVPQVALVKINVDENPQASAAFRVQSIPAVYAMKGAQVVDHFLGAQPNRRSDSSSTACCPAQPSRPSLSSSSKVTKRRCWRCSTSTMGTPARSMPWPRSG